MTDSPDLDHRRRLPRQSVEIDIDVYDSLHDVYLGKLVNLHSEGMMIVGDKPLIEEKLYKLDLHLHTSVGRCAAIHLGVDCLWVRAADINGKHWAGFSIVDISPQAAADIDTLVAYFKSLVEQQ